MAGIPEAAAFPTRQLDTKIKIAWTKQSVPTILVLLDISLFICSFPGEGKNILNAVGVATAFAGVLWSSLSRNKSRDGCASELMRTKCL